MSGDDRILYFQLNNSEGVYSGLGHVFGVFKPLNPIRNVHYLYITIYQLTLSNRII